MNVESYLKTIGFKSFEGHVCCIAKKVSDLIKLTSVSDINVMQIGFNAGHSAEIMLENNSSLKLTSFDLGSHSYVIPANDYISKRYPGRHELILGDSTITLPKYMDKKFDVIFIDGGHTYFLATTDLQNCKRFAHENTIVIMDDTMHTLGWETDFTIGPTKAWTDAISKNEIIELGHEDYMAKRGGISWGKYIL